MFTLAFVNRKDNGLAGSIYGLVLAYQFIPTLMVVPADTRVKHFVVSILVAIVINLLVSAVIGIQVTSSIIEQRTSEISTSNTNSGLFGGVERQAEIAEAAAKDMFGYIN